MKKQKSEYQKRFYRPGDIVEVIAHFIPDIVGRKFSVDKIIEKQSMVFVKFRKVRYGMEARFVNLIKAVKKKKDKKNKKKSKNKKSKS